MNVQKNLIPFKIFLCHVLFLPTQLCIHSLFIWMCLPRNFILALTFDVEKPSYLFSSLITQNRIVLSLDALFVGLSCTYQRWVMQRMNFTFASSSFYLSWHLAEEAREKCFIFKHYELDFLFLTFSFFYLIDKMMKDLEALFIMPPDQ